MDNFPDTTYIKYMNLHMDVMRNNRCVLRDISSSLGIALICITMITGQTTTTPGYYSRTSMTPLTINATCGGGCSCSSPMSASATITDGFSASNIQYPARLDCWWQLFGGAGRWLNFYKYNIGTYDTFTVHTCTSSLCNAYSKSTVYSGAGPQKGVQHMYDGEFMRITFSSGGWVSVQGQGFGASYGTHATTITYTATQCEVGSYCVNGVKTPCPAGTFANVISLSECSECNAGKYSTTLGASASSTCNNCVAGTYSSATSASTCSPCPAGTYSAAPGSTTCIPCAAGTYSAAVGASNVTTCSPCQSGTYSTAFGASSSLNCTSCLAGKYSSTTDSTTCTPCAVGTYSNATSASNVTTCTQCEAGTYSTAVGASSCQGCATGTYSPAFGASNSSTCTPCAAGTYSNAAGASDATTCTPCPAGTYSTAVGASTSGTCTPCAAGTYSPAVGAASQSMCQNCAAGTYATASGASTSNTCTPCAAGRFSTAAGASSPSICQNCGIGTYSTALGASASGTCTPCAAGTYSTAVGASTPSTCRDCPENSEGVMPDMKCACIAGFTRQEAAGPCNRCSNCIATLDFTVELSVDIESFPSSVSDTYRWGVAQSLQVALQSVAIVVVPTESVPGRRLLASTVTVHTSVTIPRARGISVSASIRGLATSTYLTDFDVRSISSIKTTISDTPITPTTSTTSTDIFDGQTMKIITLVAGITVASGVFVCMLLSYLRKSHQNHSTAYFPGNVNQVQMSRQAQNPSMFNGGQNPYQRTYNTRY